jgi:hypothetical protein
MNQGDDGFEVSAQSARCPTCGVAAADHDASPCLDHWIHERFFGKTLAAEDVPPPYSASPPNVALTI